MIETAYPMYLSYTHTSRDLEPVKNAMAKLPQSDLRDNMMENITDSCDYILSESSYNSLLSAMGKVPVSLNPDQMALFSSMSTADFTNIMNAALNQNVTIKVNGAEYSLLPCLYYDNIVADRMISLYTALIVPDEVFEEIADDSEPFC